MTRQMGIGKERGNTRREYEEENFGGIESDSYGTALSENQRETKFCQQRTSLEENVKTEQEAGGEMEREQEEERVDVLVFRLPL